MAGPWLQSAVFCARLGEGDGAITALDIVSGVEVEAGERIRVLLVVALARGEHAGPITIRVTAYAPDGDPSATIEQTEDPAWAPADTGRFVIPIVIVAAQDGVYWFEIRLGEAVATRVPLAVQWRPARLLF